MRIAERVRMACNAVDVVEILTSNPSEWIAPFFKIASFEGMNAGNELRLSKGLPPSPREDHLVLIDFDEPERILGGAVIIPFRWRALGIPALFTAFEGRFVVWAAGPVETMLSVEGMTDGDVAGEEAAVDVMQHAASTALRSLVVHLRTAIEESISAQSQVSS